MYPGLSKHPLPAKGLLPLEETGRQHTPRSCPWQRLLHARIGRHHRLAFERNKKKIYATQTVCGICGKPVDFSYKFPHPLSPCIDHIIPVAKGGHPSDLANLQLAHFWCNRQKSDKLFTPVEQQTEPDADASMALPLSTDWTAYRSR